MAFRIAFSTSTVSSSFSVVAVLSRQTYGIHKVALSTGPASKAGGRWWAPLRHEPGPVRMQETKAASPPPVQVLRVFRVSPSPGVFPATSQVGGVTRTQSPVMGPAPTVREQDYLWPLGRGAGVRAQGTAGPKPANAAGTGARQYGQAGLDATGLQWLSRPAAQEGRYVISARLCW